MFYGVLAQLGEHLPYKQGVTGSSPVGPIFMNKSPIVRSQYLVTGFFICCRIIGLRLRLWYTTVNTEIFLR